MNRFGSFWYHENQIVYDESPSQVVSSGMAGNVRNRYELIRFAMESGELSVHDGLPYQGFFRGAAGNELNRYELFRDHTGTGKIIESMMGFLLKTSPRRSGTGRLFLEF